MNSEELKKGKELYNKMISHHFGSTYYKTACQRYRKFKTALSEKYNIPETQIHNQILLSRKNDN